MKTSNEIKRVAIYSRKSKFTGKGESIGNQIEMCKQYLQVHFPNYNELEITVFEDEGFSGGNINRPQFMEMNRQIKDKKFDAIICYRLDRISRNTGDFCNLMAELENHNVAFMSLRDNFDTSTPTGRAMMMMVSVFAQLERETIAERIRDNMQELAKTGRWLGGNTPTGYKSVPVEKITVDNKKRTSYKLEIVDNEVELVTLIFNKFIEFNSLTKTETYLLQNHIMSKRGNEISRFTIKTMLQNPVYMIADKMAWDYFVCEGVEIHSNETDFNGECGVMAYNKTMQRVGKAHIYRDKKEWIIAVGKHKGIIDSEKWIKVQKLLGQNKSKSYHKPRSNTALLSGLIRCGNCGSFMRPKQSGNKTETGEVIFSYLCETKEKSKMSNCAMKNPNGNILDALVCNEVKKLASDNSLFFDRLEKAKNEIMGISHTYDSELKALEKELADNNAQIQDSVVALTKAKGSTSFEYIQASIDELHRANVLLQAKIDDLKAISGKHDLSDEEFDVLKNMFSTFANTLDTMTIEEKRNALRSIIRKAVWDGSNLHIYFFGNDGGDIAIDDGVLNEIIIDKDLNPADSKENLSETDDGNTYQMKSLWFCAPIRSFQMRCRSMSQ